MKNMALFVAAVAFAPAWTSAEVLDSASNGFTVKTTLTIHAAPDEVYRKIVRNVGDWWNPQHSFSRDAHNLSMEEKVQGCFCEKLPNNGGVRHMEIVNLAPGKSLVMTGALGPMQGLGVAGNMSIQLSPSEDGTKLEVTYAAGGYLKAGLNIWAAPSDAMIAEQFTRLKNYIEHGDPAAK